MQERPDGITADQWRYYQMGQKAHAEGQPKEHAQAVFEMKNRCWFIAGWVDSDMMKNALSSL